MHEKNKELANLRPAVKSTLCTADPFLENKLYYPFPVSVTPPTPPPPFQPCGPTTHQWSKKCTDKMHNTKIEKSFIQPSSTNWFLGSSNKVDPWKIHSIQMRKNSKLLGNELIRLRRCKITRCFSGSSCLGFRVPARKHLSKGFGAHPPLCLVAPVSPAPSNTVSYTWLNAD